MSINEEGQDADPIEYHLDNRRILIDPGRKIISPFVGDFSQGNRSYPTNEDAAVEDGHGDGDFQRYSFADANIEVWGLTQTDITAEEM